MCGTRGEANEKAKLVEQPKRMAGAQVRKVNVLKYTN